MYEALRQMRVSLPDGGTADIKPGEEVIGFTSWPFRNQQAALNAHYVRVRPADPVNQHLAQRPSVPEARKAIAAAIAAVAEREAREAAEKAQTKALADDILANAEQNVTVTETAEVEPVGDLTCEHCDFTAATAQGLKLHLTRKHKS